MAKSSQFSVPETSEVLLRQLGANAQHARWTEFVARYRPMMERYLTRHFPALEADDIIQDTLLALAKVLPNYVYAPNETGRFHNYLTGILRNKALALLDHDTRRIRREAIAASQRALARDEHEADRLDEEAWKESIFEIALAELLADDALARHTREIFRALVLEHEPPAEVAERFGVERNAVDQVKNRLMARLRTIVSRLKKLA